MNMQAIKDLPERAAASRPRVSVGLPVYNGERYIGEALESLMVQTYENIEIIVCDNDSTDSTLDIVNRFAASDRRIRAVRNSQNIGGAENFNRVFKLAAGDYFKWMAHDDVCKPRFIERCVMELNADPSIVLAYPTPVQINEHGKEVGVRGSGLEFSKETPFERFRDQMIKAHACLHLFGVVRSNALTRTGLHGRYPGADRVLLAELALQGKFKEVPERLLLHREHPHRATRFHSTPQEIMEWHDPGSAGRLSFPTWMMLGGYLSATFRSPVKRRDQMLCLLQMAAWCKGKRGALLGDVLNGMKFLAGRR